ncbi:MAG: flagellar protein FlaG [Armatimonadetes bacterium]|nr:flagellar protein FlaG [Armatimonadota bacterium]
MSAHPISPVPAIPPSPAESARPASPAEGIARVAEVSAAPADLGQLPRHVRSEVERMLRELPEARPPAGISIEFSVYEALNAVVIRVRNVQTGEILLEFPPERLLEAMTELRRQAGLLVDHKA